MKMAAAQGIASVVSDDELNPSYIIPSVFNADVCPAVSRAVAEEAQREGMTRTGALAPSS
jgi:malate dehydrogenase (oxaloacetate-decarboxylating)